MGIAPGDGLVQIVAVQLIDFVALQPFLEGLDLLGCDGILFMDLGVAETVALAQYDADDGRFARVGDEFAIIFAQPGRAAGSVAAIDQIPFGDLCLAGNKPECSDSHDQEDFVAGFHVPSAV